MPKQRLFLYHCPRCGLDIPKDNAIEGRCPKCSLENVEITGDDVCLSENEYADCASCPDFEECFGYSLEEEIKEIK